MRRLFLVVLGSALILSACGQSKGWPDGSPAATVAPSIVATSVAAATAAPTVVMSDAPTAPAASEAVPTQADTHADTEWTVFAPADGGFTSKFPVVPTLTTDTTKTAAGDTATSLWTYEQGGNLAYFVLLAQYPKGAMVALKATVAYDTAVQAMVGGTAGLALASQTDMMINGHAGRSFLLTSTEGSVKGEMVLVGDNLYTAYVAFTSSVDRSVVDTFLADFSLTI